MAKATALLILLIPLLGCTPKLTISAIDLEARTKINEIIADCCPPEEVSDADTN